MMAGAMIRETIPTESGTIVEASLHASHLITLGHLSCCGILCHHKVQIITSSLISVVYEATATSFQVQYSQHVVSEYRSHCSDHSYSLFIEG
jgi:hypothetical protein